MSGCTLSIGEKTNTLIGCFILKENVTPITIAFLYPFEALVNLPGIGVKLNFEQTS